MGLYKQSNWFDNKLNVSHILTTIAMIVAIAIWINNLDKRIEQNAIKLTYQDKATDQNKQSINQVRAEIKADLNKINAKLDRLIERQINQ